MSFTILSLCAVILIMRVRALYAQSKVARSVNLHSSRLTPYLRTGKRLTWFLGILFVLEGVAMISTEIYALIFQQGPSPLVICGCSGYLLYLSPKLQLPARNDIVCCRERWWHSALRCFLVWPIALARFFFYTLTPFQGNTSLAWDCTANTSPIQSHRKHQRNG